MTDSQRLIDIPGLPATRSFAEANAVIAGDLARSCRRPRPRSRSRITSLACRQAARHGNCTEDFTRMPDVINGASDLFVDVYGDAGRHARSAVGMQQLHYGMAIEIEGIFEIAEERRPGSRA